MKPECKQCEYFLTHKFKKPTVGDIQKYCAEIGYPNFDSQYFFDKQETVGWCVKIGNGWKPMASWKGAIRTWVKAAIRRGEIKQESETFKSKYEKNKET